MSLQAEQPAVESPDPTPQLSATKETTVHGRLPRMIETSPPLKGGFKIHLGLVERGEETCSQTASLFPHEQTLACHLR